MNACSRGTENTDYSLQVLPHVPFLETLHQHINFLMLQYLSLNTIYKNIKIKIPEFILRVCLVECIDRYSVLVQEIIVEFVPATNLL